MRHPVRLSRKHLLSRCLLSHFRCGHLDAALAAASGFAQALQDTPTTWKGLENSSIESEELPSEEGQ